MVAVAAAMFDDQIGTKAVALLGIQVVVLKALAITTPFFKTVKVEDEAVKSNLKPITSPVVDVMVVDSGVDPPAMMFPLFA